MKARKKQAMDIAEAIEKYHKGQFDHDDLVPVLKQSGRPAGTWFAEFLDKTFEAGMRFGRAIGFKGSREEMCTAVLREVDFWNHHDLDYFEWEGPETEVFSRLACLEGLHVLLRPLDHDKVGDGGRWFDLIDEYYELVLVHHKKAGPPPTAEEFARWRANTIMTETVGDLEKELLDTQVRLNKAKLELDNLEGVLEVAPRKKAAA
jgi:hypothetical protein